MILLSLLEFRLYNQHSIPGLNTRVKAGKQVCVTQDPFTLSRKLNSNWLKHKGISWFSHQYLQIQLDSGLKLLKKLGSNFQLYFLSIISFLRFERVDHCSFISQNDMKERGELLPDSLIKGLLIVSFQPQLFGLCSVNISKVGTWLEGIK